MSEPSAAPDEVTRESRLRWILVAGVAVAMLSYFIFSIFEVPLKADNFTNSFSTSPGGHSALRELLTKNGREVRAGEAHLKLPEFEYGRTDTLALLEPLPPYVERFSNEFDAMFAAAQEEKTSLLVAFPKRHYEQVNTGENDAVTLEEQVIGPADLKDMLKRTGFDRWLTLSRRDAKKTKITWPGSDTPGEAEDVSFEVEDFVQVFGIKNGALGDKFEVLAACDDGSPVVVRYRPETYQDYGGVLLVSDPDFLTNRFIGNPGGGSMAMRLFSQTPKQGKIEIDEDLHGFSTDATLQYLAATPPGLWVTLSVALLLLVFAWRQATVLRPRKAEPHDRQARKFSIEGLARMMERAGEHDNAYRRIVRRSRLVLGMASAEVQGAGMGGTRAIRKGKTGRITRIQGGTSEERLINTARRVAHQKRTGETEHGIWQD